MAMARGDRSRSPPRDGSVSQIHKLVVMRETARQTGDYEAADGIRERLSSMGVTLFDKTNSWRSTDGRSGRIPTWAELEAGGGFEEELPGHSGAPRELTGEEEQIRGLVQQREQARAGKDFSRSDQIRDELKLMGVDLFDKEKMWRKKDGLSGVIIGYSGSGPTDLEVSTLVVQREKARQSSDYSTADVIRDELKRYGVEIDDKTKLWRSSRDGRQGPVPSWSAIMGGDAGGGPPGAHQNGFGGASQPFGGHHEITAQIMNAAHAASTVNPAAAQQILQALQSLGGPGGSMPMGGRGGPPPSHHSARGGFQAAPLPGGGQARAYNHQSSQGSRSGHSSSARSPGVDDASQFCRQLSAEGRRPSDSEINWLVEMREKARQNKDYASSDSLRDLLRSSLGIELHEKEKRWSSADGREGPIPLWSNFG